MKRAYVTAISHGDGYAPGVEALGVSLRASGTREPMVVMATADVSPETRARLATQGWRIRDVEALHGPSRGRSSRFVHAFVKLRAWQLTEFDEVVWLDADTLVLENVDDLFERPELSAAPDWRLPDRFNSGVMVLRPSLETFERMAATLASAESCDRGEQGFLNRLHPDWYSGRPERRLPIGYNRFPFVYQLLRSHPGLEGAVDEQTKILHYAAQKPWHATPQLTGASKLWWNMYYGAHPEKDRRWRRRAHALEDWAFDRVVDLFIGGEP